MSPHPADWSRCRTPGCNSTPSIKDYVRKGAGRLCLECYRGRRAEARKKAWATSEEHRNKVRAKKARSQARLRAEAIAAYGGQCVCCGEKEPSVLQVDHYGPDSLKGFKSEPHRWQRGYHELVRLRKLGFPKEGIRLLCANCNRSMRRSNGQICHHEAEKAGMVGRLLHRKDWNSKPRRPNGRT